MKREEHTIYTSGKIIPARYADVILGILEHYPELKETHIHFLLKKKHPVPYGTAPALGAVFKKPAKRIYHISILEEAVPPLEKALFKNLTAEMQQGVIAHELIHVLQFQGCSRAELLKLFFSYPFPGFQRRLERNADKGAIEKGFGKELYAHAFYIRQIPGYAEERPAIEKNYLSPQEILDYMKHPVGIRPSLENGFLPRE